MLKFVYIFLQSRFYVLMLKVKIIKIGSLNFVKLFLLKIFYFFEK